MSEPSPPPAPTPGHPAPAPARPSSWKYTLGLIALLVAGAVGYYLYVRSQNPEPQPIDELIALKEYLTRLAANQKLADGYTDTDPKDLVADAPKEPTKWTKVEGEITFTAVGTDKPAEAKEAWKDFIAALEKSTGKKVTYLEDVQSIEDQFTAMREGRLHVTAFNTGAVPTAVNTAGFVPLFAPADEQGQFAIQMEILVRADSGINAPADLKGKTVGLVALSSNSGAKAAMVDLKDKFGLWPARDYKYALTGGHTRSIQELLAGKHDAVCVASDLLQREEGAGKVDKSKYKVIYTSVPFPPLCFGVPHNLPPDVRDKVKAAFTGFKFTPNTPGAGQGKSKFIAVNYEKDWEYVRKIEETLSHLLDGK